MEYDFRQTEKFWQQYWAKHQTFKTNNPGEEGSERPPYYVLDMFPYPSGAGLHVGHPLGYIASDIVARFKRHSGFNVLHPMGYDSFGLPAEQYAIQTGQHPAITTDQNIQRYREQLDKIGFSFDWSREVRTSDPDYYKWTQWIFLQLFNSWYNPATQKAEGIHTLIEKFEKEKSVFSESKKMFSELNEKEKSDVLMDYRLAYLGEAFVNWCAALGTVLANDEVKDGVSERGGYPVERKKMKQWNMRITAYSDRLLNDLETIDWSESLKEQQRNWIGKSEGVIVKFCLISDSSSLIPNPSPEEKGTLRTKKPFYQTADKSVWPYLKSFSKANKKNATEAEQKLWEAVRDRKLGYKIRRQHAIGIFIADFLVLEKKLVIEVDGEIHQNQKEYDEERTRFLNNEGYTVIRFTNHEVINDLESVLEKIKSELDSIHRNSPSLLEKGLGDEAIEIFTTRPDTIFGVSYVTLAPENELVQAITTNEQKAAVETYLEETKNRSERERMADVKRVSGVFTGAYVSHPFTQEPIQVWVGDYVLAGYGTGAVMAVPAHDSRDFAFASHFNLPKPQVVQPKEEWDFSKASYDEKEGICINSDFLNGLKVKDAIRKAIDEIENRSLGKGQINYRLRDAVFGRQRYWGEPIPIFYENGIPKAVEEKYLPVILPEVDKYLPTQEGEPPLARSAKWNWDAKNNCVVETGKGMPLENTTMPGWAGSSWYYLRYMDAANKNEFVSKEAADYWKNVDLYIGGSEHATGHLLYVRFWTKFLKDRGFISIDEPAKKLINQGMIQGRSNFVYRVKDSNQYVSKNLKNDYETNAINVDVNIVEDDVLDIEKFKQWRDENANAEFILENEKYICGVEVEKMSKSKYNVVTPDNIVESHGADALRLYEMFLGPLEQSKPWNTNGLSGVSGFLRKLWRLYHTGADASFAVSDAATDRKELKSLHKTIKKVTEDIQNFSFNTSVSTFMICVNELTDLKCNKRAILEPLVVLISPYAPHIAEELWQRLGHNESISTAQWPEWREEYLQEDSFAYPISVNGKVKFNIEFPLALDKVMLEKEVLKNEQVLQLLQGATPKKVIVVPGKIVNMVV